MLKIAQPAYAVHLIDDRRVITYFETCPEYATPQPRPIVTRHTPSDH